MSKLAIGIPPDAEPARLRATLAALNQHTPPGTPLLLLSEAGSAPIEATSGVAPLQLRGAHPMGGAAAFNRLASASDARIIVLLECGALVGPGWLERLLGALATDARNGLAGPSTNRAWNEQAAFRGTPDTEAGIATAAAEAARRFDNTWRALEPLHSLADFCYAVRREVIDEIGLADEGYALGPCWEMDYNIRAARAGWRGVWVCGAYVHRMPPSARRQAEEARLFDASKRRYQDKFCGARLRGEKTDYRAHCRGDACPNFAPARLLAERGVLPSSAAAPSAGDTKAALVSIQATGAPLASCIMPTCDRVELAAQAVQLFLRQDYPERELIVMDDGVRPVEPHLPRDPRVRLVRLPAKKCIGAKRNLACAAARGDVILHWDDDDWYPPDRVRRQVEVFAAGTSVLCGTSILFYCDPAAGRAWRYRYGGGRPWVAGNTLAYRKSWWAAHPFPEIQVGEDTRFVWTASGREVHDLQWPGLCVARVHPGNTSRKTTTGSYWEPRPLQELQSLLGAEWPAFVTPSLPAERGKDSPLISCIMPTFNRRPFLPLALESFLAQDYPKKELLLVDDGSDAVSDLAQGLETVRYVRLPRRHSIGAKRNLACEAARGSIVAHWDDDDWYGPSRLRLQVASIVAGEADLTGLEDAYEFDLDEGRFWRPKPFLHRRMYEGDVHGGTLTYRKSLFEEGCRYPAANLAEDAAFLRQVVNRGRRVRRLSNPGCFVYMRHGSNSWRYLAGKFLDPQGWENVEPPEAFSERWISAYRAAGRVIVAGRPKG